MDRHLNLERYGESDDLVKRSHRKALSSRIKAARECKPKLEVHQLGGGNSSVEFEYRIVAKRKGYESVRLADVTEPFKPMNIRRLGL